MAAANQVPSGESLIPHNKQSGKHSCGIRPLVYQRRMGKNHKMCYSPASINICWQHSLTKMAPEQKLGAGKIYIHSEAKECMTENGFLIEL